jgi:hypothetical protein
MVGEWVTPGTQTPHPTASPACRPAGTADPSATVTFAELGVPGPLVDALAATGITTPFRSPSRSPPYPTRSPAVTSSARVAPDPARRSRSP